MDEFACTLQDFRRSNCWSTKGNIKDLFFVILQLKNT
jgi:hypothetical protein